MTKFIVGFLLGLILGIGGTAAFLITAQGGDYLVGTSPRVRELENSLKQGDQEREWLRNELRESADVVAKLESRFIALATRFDDLTSRAATLLGAPETSPTAAPPAASAAAPDRTAPPEPTEKPEPTPTPTARPTKAAATSTARPTKAAATQTPRAPSRKNDDGGLRSSGAPRSS